MPRIKNILVGVYILYKLKGTIKDKKGGTRYK
jgi:hypothetical protein